MFYISHFLGRRAFGVDLTYAPWGKRGSEKANNQLVS